MKGWWVRYKFVIGASMAYSRRAPGADRAASAFLNFASSAAAYPSEPPAKARVELATGPLRGARALKGLIN